MDRKPESANCLVPLSTVYSERFWRQRQTLSFDTLEEGGVQWGAPPGWRHN